MNKRELFYNALWGSNDFYKSIWYGEAGQNPNKSIWSKSTAELISEIDRLKASKKYNIYHACSLFKSKRRLQTNVEAIKFLWLDIDLNKTSFTSVKEMAETYLPKFSEFRFGLDFWVVFTGNGLHVYWIFDKVINKIAWQLLASELAQFVIDKNISIDTSRTEDSASIMRAPSTTNYKDPNTQSKLIKVGGLININGAALQEVGKKIEYKKSDLKKSKSLKQEDMPDSDGVVVTAKCQVIKQFKDTGLEGSEPVRYKAISVLRLCNDGADLIHSYFSKHSKYTEKAANIKIMQLESKNIGPALCESFAEFGVCEGCKHKGKLTSPIQLGYIPKPLEIKVDNIKNDAARDRAEEFIKHIPNSSWSVSTTGIYKEVKGETKKVCDVPFYIIDKFSEDARDQSIITVFIRAHTKIGVIDFKVPLRYMAEDKKLLAEFNSRGIFPVSKIYFKAYITQYCLNTAHIKPHCASRSLGWQPDNSFLYGSLGQGFDSSGDAITSIIDSKAVSYINGFESKGSLATWSDVFNKFATSPQWHPHLFSAICSLGAPLLPFTSAKGFILSLQGHSGCGKTLSHMFAASVWGNPATAGCIGTKDTNTSMLGRLGAVRNLPLRLDEATALPTAVLSNLVYELVNGRGRARATVDGSLSSTATEWQTITLVTTNSPLLEHKISDISEAARYRILELSVGMPDDMLAVGKEIGKIMEDNHGVCGPEFAKYITSHMSEVKTTLDNYFNAFQELVSSDKRFWVSCGAIAFTAAEIGIKLKLFNFDLEALKQWFFDILRLQTDLNNDFIKDSRGFDTLDEFTHSLRDFLSGHILKINRDGTELGEPPREIKARMLYHDDGSIVLLVRAPILTEFIKKHFVDSVKNVRTMFKIDDAKSSRSGKVVGRYYSFTLKNAST